METHMLSIFNFAVATVVFIVLLLVITAAVLLGIEFEQLTRPQAGDRR